MSAAFWVRIEIGALVAPFVGFVVDRVGPRVPVVLGVWVVGAGFILLSLTHSLWAFHGAVIIIRHRRQRHWRTVSS